MDGLDQEGCYRYLPANCGQSQASSQGPHGHASCPKFTRFDGSSPEAGKVVADGPQRVPSVQCDIATTSVECHTPPAVVVVDGPTSLSLKSEASPPRQNQRGDGDVIMVDEFPFVNIRREMWRRSPPPTFPTNCTTGRMGSQNQQDIVENNQQEFPSQLDRLESMDTIANYSRHTHHSDAKNEMQFSPSDTSASSQSWPRLTGAFAAFRPHDTSDYSCSRNPRIWEISEPPRCQHPSMFHIWKDLKDDKLKDPRHNSRMRMVGFSRFNEKPLPSVTEDDSSTTSKSDPLPCVNTLSASTPGSISGDAQASSFFVKTQAEPHPLPSPIPQNTSSSFKDTASNTSVLVGNPDDSYESRTKKKLQAARSARSAARNAFSQASVSNRKPRYDRVRQEGWPPEGFNVVWGEHTERVWNTYLIPSDIPDNEVWNHLMVKFTLPSASYCLWPGCPSQAKGAKGLTNLRRHVETVHLKLKLECNECGRRIRADHWRKRNSHESWCSRLSHMNGDNAVESEGDG